MGKVKILFSSEKTRAEYYSVYDTALESIPITYNTVYIGTNFGNTHIIHCGNKGNPALVLLHCMGFSSTCWYKNLETLSRLFEIYCIDSIGQPGKTECNRTKISGEDYYQWLIEVFDALKLDKVNIAGWSLGGFYATGFAMNHPERVLKVAALSPPGTVSPVSATFFIKLFPMLFGGKDEKINQFLKWISGSDNMDSPNPAFSVFIAGMKSYRGWAGVKLSVYPEKAFKNLKVPYLIMLGDKDPVYRKGVQNRVVKKLNKINPFIIAETVEGTHGFPIQQFEITNTRLISFFLGTQKP